MKLMNFVCVTFIVLANITNKLNNIMLYILVQLDIIFNKY